MSVAEPEPKWPEDDGGADGGGGGGSGGGMAQWGRLGGIAAASAMAVVFAAAAWYALQRPDLAAPTTVEVPLVKAELGPVKEKPKDPGGLKIPNQDKLVYERITPKAKAPVKEKLAPAPEEPIVKVAEARNEAPIETPKVTPKPAAKTAPPPPALSKPGPKADIAAMKPAETPNMEPTPPPAGQTAVTPVEAPKLAQNVTAAPKQAPKQPIIKSSVTPGAESLLPASKPNPPVKTKDAAPSKPKVTETAPPKPVTAKAPAKEAEKAVVKAPVKAPEKTAVKTTPVVKKLPKVIPPEIKTVTAVRVSAPGYRIQFAAYRSAARAKAAWARILKAHGAVVDGLPPHTQRVDLGQRGVYFRVQAGNFKTARAARLICAKLKAKRQDCIIVVPKKK
jgi:hypothetical protein